MFIPPICSFAVKSRGALSLIVVPVLVLPMWYIRPGVIWLWRDNSYVASLVPVGGCLFRTFSSCKLASGVFLSSDGNHACPLIVGDSRSITTWSLLQLPADFSCVVPMVRNLRLFQVMISWFPGWSNL